VRRARLRLVVGFAAWQGSGTLVLADLLLLGSVACGAVGYVAGAPSVGADARRARDLLGARAAACR
jgi:hypothetical protein